MDTETNQLEGGIAPLKKVTPLSKYLAMALMVTLPFIGAFVGYMLASINTLETGKTVTNQSEYGTTTNQVSSEPLSKDISDARQEYLAQFTKYPTYEVRTIQYGDSKIEALFGIENSGTEHQLTYLRIFSKPAIGGWVYYATDRPDTDAGQHLRFAYNPATRTLKLLETAPMYHDVWFVDEERISPDGLKFTSVHRSDLYGEDPHSLYVVDLAADSVQTIKVLPDNETFIEAFDSFANVPMSNVKWVDNSTVWVTVFDATKWIEKPPPVWGKFHPYLRTELIKI